MVKMMGVTAIPGLIAGSWDMYSTGLAVDELLILAAAITLVEPEQAKNVVAAGSSGSAGAASVVFLSDAAFVTFEDMADGRLDVD
jgi:hypothetical protein